MPCGLVHFLELSASESTESADPVNFGSFDPASVPMSVISSFRHARWHWSEGTSLCLVVFVQILTARILSLRLDSRDRDGCVHFERRFVRRTESEMRGSRRNCVFHSGLSFVAEPWVKTLQDYPLYDDEQSIHGICSVQLHYSSDCGTTLPCQQHIFRADVFDRVVKVRPTLLVVRESPSQ